VGLEELVREPAILLSRIEDGPDVLSFVMAEDTGVPAPDASAVESSPRLRVETAAHSAAVRQKAVMETMSVRKCQIAWMLPPHLAKVMFSPLGIILQGKSTADVLSSQEAMGPVKGLESRGASASP